MGGAWLGRERSSGRLVKAMAWVGRMELDWKERGKDLEG